MSPTSLIRGYKKLIVYQKSKDLIILTYKLTDGFPRNEAYVLIPQMRRAAISVTANVVEGYSKSSKKEYHRYLDISIGSLNELELYFNISYELNYFDRMKLEKVINLLMEVKRLLYSYQKSLRNKS